MMSNNNRTETPNLLLPRVNTTVTWLSLASRDPPTTTTTHHHHLVVVVVVENMAFFSLLKTLANTWSASYDSRDLHVTFLLCPKRPLQYSPIGLINSCGCTWQCWLACRLISTEGCHVRRGLGKRRISWYRGAREEREIVGGCWSRDKCFCEFEILLFGVLTGFKSTSVLFTSRSRLNLIYNFMGVGVRGRCGLCGDWRVGCGWFCHVSLALVGAILTAFSKSNLVKISLRKRRCKISLKSKNVEIAYISRSRYRRENLKLGFCSERFADSGNIISYLLISLLAHVHLCIRFRPSRNVLIRRISCDTLWECGVSACRVVESYLLDQWRHEISRE